MQSSVPTTSLDCSGLGLSSSLLRRLFEWNENMQHEERSSDTVEMALLRDLTEALGTDLNLNLESYGTPEAIAQLELKAVWSLLSGFTDVQELITETELKERLVARSLRGDCVSDIHRAEDAALAKELTAIYGERSSRSHDRADAPDAPVSTYLDDMRNILCEDPLTGLSETLESMHVESHKLDNKIEDVKSLISASSNGIGTQNRQVLQETLDQLCQMKLDIDQTRLDLADIFRAANCVFNFDDKGYISSFNEFDPEKRSQDLQSVMSPVVSTLEALGSTNTAGCLIGDLRQHLSESMERVSQNPSVNSIKEPPVTVQMLEYAMLKELFPDGHILTEHLYRDLTSKSNIRLLEHCGADEEGRLCFHLEEFDRTNAPPFMALSYVWGDPRPTLYKQMPSSSQRTRHIICNDQKVLISVNLDDAINTIFSIWEGETDPMGGVEHRRIWIDQVCINQNDDQEKNAQVAQMDLIYQAAARVIAWIGPDNFLAARAIDVIRSLQGLSREEYTAPG
ncbi:hypothetical protein B5807_12169 [Epicoccum nigrum]|uniref:Heterokaryon incompatibility domain-containing protein n=1 Tax=Epicoccum nigrum TaxID=105696 RepID=A0A1Y2LHJ2_EPING|nr:hypothetical protein B5807_12169 [Epicoccum nigrum]